MRIHYPAVGVVAMLTSIVASIVPANAVPAVPYSDYSAQGLITLCDRAGHPVTTGQITDKPFVWRAVSSQPASAAYSGHGQTATLLAYQPRPHAYPPQWSGDTLTSSSTYTNPAAPMAQATRLDFTLQDFLHEFPPMMNGFIQLRIYLGIPGKETLTTTYPSADIQVTGSTWTLVDGGHSGCTAGSATASEVVAVASASPHAGTGSAASSTATTTPGTTPSSTATTSSGSSTTTPAGGASGATGPPPGDANQQLGAQAASGSPFAAATSSSFWRPMALAAVLLAVAGLLTLRARRRRPQNQHVKQA